MNPNSAPSHFDPPGAVRNPARPSLQTGEAQNDEPHDYRRDQCVHHLFQEQVRLTPDANALIWRDQQLSYRELNEQSNQLVYRIQQLGVRSGDRVAILLDRSPEFVVSVLAILKCGCAYVPLATEYPVERLRFMLQDSDVSLLITNQKLPHGLELGSIVVLNLAAEAEVLANAPMVDPPQVGTASDLAYIMYTSGSTGQPKGVCIPHRGIVRLVRGQTYADFSPTQRFLLLAPVSFDASTFELWGPLLNGATCVIYPLGNLEFDNLEEVLRENQITCFWLTAGLFNQIIDLRPTLLSTVRHILTGGDVLSVPHVQRALTLLPHLRLTNGYGPTESTTFACCYDIAPGSIFSGMSVPIGRPIANTRVCVLDDMCQPVPVGVTGELHIGGDGLAHGYWNRSDLTAERFVPDPFSNDPNERLYRTGDFVRYLDDSNLEFLGRADKQVKIRGFRIELEEIEAVLGQHPDVARCAVVVQNDKGGEKQIVAFLVLRDKATQEVQELRGWLAAKLPDFMIPARFATLDTLPLTPNGKLDRKALECLENQVLSTSYEYIAPRNELERELAQIWQEVLRQREPIGVHDHFLDLGGHSLLAMRIVSQLSNRLAIHVPARWVLEYPTLVEFVGQIESSGGDLSGFESIPCVSRQAALPMSFGQQRFWILQETLPDPATYNVPVVHRVNGPVDAVLLQICLRALVERHEALRTALVQDGDSLWQQIIPIETLALPWQEADWRALTAEEQEATACEEVRRPFDLRQAPLWRVLWSEVGPDEHLLAFTFHHSIVDEWSLRLFFRELEQLYATGGNAEKAGLVALPVQYADFAVWQRHRVAGEKHARDVEYWTEQLRYPPRSLTLPGGLPRRQQGSNKGDVYRFVLSHELLEKLRSISRAEGVSLFTLMLAAFQVWIFRHTGQDDILVSTPIAYRERDELQGIFGYSLNTIPIRTRFSGHVSFREFLAETQRTVVAALKHGELPFEEMAKLATPVGSGRHATLHQIMFVLLEEGVAPWRLGTTTTQSISVHTGTAKCDVALSITPNNDNKDFVCELEYATDLLSSGSIHRMATHWLELLRAVADDPDASISSVNILAQSEQQQLTVSWNATRCDYPLDKCVHQLFEEQARQTPLAVAVSCAGRSLTYSELNGRANRLAIRLRHLGVGPDVIVALCALRSVEMVVGILGILKAGGAYLPLDPTHPAERLTFTIQDSLASVLVTHERLADVIPVSVSHRVFLDDPSLLGETDDLPCQAGPQHSAYVIYTSGSTGTPKGVCITHKSAVNLVHAMQIRPGVCASDRVLAVATASFDASVLELLMPLALGAQVVIASDAHRMNVTTLIAMLASENITVLLATPNLWRAILDTGWQGTPHLTALCGGEAMPAALAQELVKRCGKTWNLYGPTEATVFVTAKRIAADGEVTIGQPIANTRTYILDGHCRPVPIGVAGELFIGGEGVARGYWRRPELTAERFLPDPFDMPPGARMYRTGDLARWREDGDIEYLGRADQQVKIRGFRVELEEIEAVLETHPSVARCAVIVQTRGTEDQRLTAMLVPCSDTTAVDPHGLRQYLTDKLPSYMIPSHFAVLDALPLSPNGKVDRKKLTNWHGITLSATSDFLAPRTAFEAVLARVWQDLFQLEQVGIRDDFFALGGHSLLAVRAVGRIQEATGIPVSLSEFLASPTIERLAQSLEHTHASDPLLGAVHQADPIPKADRQQDLPMSFGQQRFWILQQVLPNPATYNMPVAHRILGLVDVQCLKTCLQVMLERHEALRTALLQQGDEYLQQIHPAESTALPWREANWQDLTRALQEAALRDEVRRPFDLTQAPLWRVLWSEIGPNEHWLTLTFHHTIVDEWSLRVFFRELELLYTTGGGVTGARLTALPVQYADYAVWQRRRLTDEIRQHNAAYWAEQLRDPPPPLPLPTDVSHPKQRTDGGTFLRFALPENVVGELRNLARTEGVSLFTLMLAAFQVWLYRYTGQDDLIVATPVTDRDRDELQGLIGYFLNTLPIRTRLTRQASFRQTLAQIRQTVLAGLEHGGLPFEEIVGLTASAGDGSRTPLHQVMFVLLEEGFGSLQLGGGVAKNNDACSGEERHSRGAKADVVNGVHTGTSKCDLLLSMAPEGDQWICEFEYPSELFSAGSVQQMATHWEELLRAIIADPDQRIASLNLMPASERRQVLEAWNDTQRAYPRNKCVHDIFDEQVAKTPEAVAVSCDGQVLTYRELNQRANRLAHYLRHKHVDTGTCVGVYVGRSIDFVVSVLAILKAGGTYVPLAQDIPLERLRYILADSATTAIITNAPLPKDLCAPHITIVDLNREATAIGSSTDQPVLCHTKATDPAYVMYTSGSTGRPKGVAVPHRGIVRLVRSRARAEHGGAVERATPPAFCANAATLAEHECAVERDPPAPRTPRPPLRDYVDFTSPQRFLLLAPTSFDASTFELWGPLLHGNECVIYPPPLPDLEDLEQTIRTGKVTCLWLTAGLFNQIIDHRPSLLSTVDHVLTGGEALSVAHVTRALELHPHLRLTNGYGPTECTTFACTYEIDRSDTFSTGSVPIGRPIANTQCYVLDEQGTPVPVGVAGELYLGGDGLACGYLNLPELTTERFVPNPFSHEPGARLYRTGDYVRYNSDGLLEFLGRRDQQVKIRGFRVELPEIEAVLEEHPNITACAVVIDESGISDKHLIAWIVPRQPTQLTSHDLREWLDTRLPNYMVPTHYSVADTLPLMHNGKVDRHALAQKIGAPLETGTEYTAPCTQLEHILANIWERVLNFESIGVHDNFFEIGGNSLTAVKVIDHIQSQMGVLIPVTDLISHPTIARFAYRMSIRLEKSEADNPRDRSSNSEKPPIYLIGWHLDLADLQLEDRKCYVIPFPDVSQSQEHCTVEYIASRCCETLHCVQPTGPYFLFGFSLAGLVAYEMTHRLRTAGEEVAFVAIIDTTPSRWHQRVAINAIALTGRLLHMPFSMQVDGIRYVLRVFKHIGECIREAVFHPRRLANAVLCRMRMRPHPKSPNSLFDCAEVIRQPDSADETNRPIAGYYSWAHRRYAPQPTSGHVVLLFTEELMSLRLDPSRKWNNLVDSHETHTIPGTHLTCIRDHKQTLLTTLRHCLNKSERRIASTQEPD